MFSGYFLNLRKGDGEAIGKLLHPAENAAIPGKAKP